MQHNVPSVLLSRAAEPRARSVPATARLAGQALADPAEVPVRLLVVPDQMPPYDDAVTPAQLATPSPTRSVAPSGPPAVRSIQPRPSARQQASGWPGQFAQVLAETLAGSRPAEQLRPWTTDLARKQIKQLGPLHATGQRPRVRKIMTSAPSGDVVEMTAIVGFGPRTKVLAFRLERADTLLCSSAGRGVPASPNRRQWLCTAIESA
jgi:hypothetical protein